MVTTASKATREKRAIFVLLAAIGLLCCASFGLAVFVTPIVAKSTYCGPVAPAPTQFAIDIGDIVRRNLFVPFPMTSMPLYVACAGILVRSNMSRFGGWAIIVVALLCAALLLMVLMGGLIVCLA